jgi:hypothetical protein
MFFRQSLSRSVRCCARNVLLLALGSVAASAYADELPARKAGLWEMKMTGIANVTTRECVSADTDKKMQGKAVAGDGMECSKLENRKIAGGYAIDAVCEMSGVMRVTSHAEVTGDFASAYTIKQTGHIEMKGTGMGGPRDTNVTIQAKWLGACPPDWKPGDMEIPGSGGRRNVLSDAAKNAHAK